jgi:predicted DNA-binding transcriptional regulator AlpA
MSLKRKAGRRPRSNFLSTAAAALADHQTAPALSEHENRSSLLSVQTAHPTHETLLTDFDLERITGRARSTWQKARLTGTGPPFIRLGRLVRYRMSEFNAWLRACPSIRSTSEAA